jgi:hypothetical protein
MRRYTPMAGGASIWRARYRRVARFVRHVRRRVRKVVLTWETVALALALVVGFLVAHL